MGYFVGGRVLAERLEKLRADLHDYYGAISQMKSGITVKVPPKPIALLRYEQTIKLGVPLQSGGIYDQPFDFILEWAICDEVRTVFQVVEANSRAAEAKQ